MFSLADSSSDDEDDVYTSSVPFPSTPSPLDPQHPVPRTNSSSVLLVNGKPLKSSLKSSSSSPSILIPARTRSEPSTPLLTQKNVHFPEGDLVSVRVFNRSARPASLSKPTSDDTETETESEASAAWPASASYFRSLAAIKPTRKAYELDPLRTSPIPRKHDHYANVHLESLHLKASGPSPPAVTGSVLVRNIAYEKSVVLRFTLDNWQTTSEVSAHHAASLSGLPDTFVRAVAPVANAGLTLGDLAAKSPEWDRFAFTIKLEDHASNLDQKTMWLVVRYAVPGWPEDGGEWWDNNTGGNYRIAFRPSVPASATTAALPKLAVPMMRSASASAATSLHQKFYSYPSATATATATAAAAASSRLTFPVYHQQQQQYLQRQQLLYQQRRKQEDPPQSILPERTQVQANQELHAAVAQTTLSRLKKLNLRNYAAPSPSTSPITSPASSRRPSMSDATVPDIVEISSTASSSPSSSCSGSGSGSGSSTETTPMSSPKTDFLGLGLGLGLGSGLISSERKGSYSPPGDIEFGLDMGMQFQDGAPATSVPISTGIGMNHDWAMGLSTSPPFSMLSQGSFVGRLKKETSLPPSSTTMTTTTTTTTMTKTTSTATITSLPVHPPRRVKRPTTTGRSLTSASSSSSSSSDTDRADRYRPHPRPPQDEDDDDEEELQRTPRAPLSPASPSNPINLAINTSTLLDVIKEKSTSPGRRRGRYHAFSSGSSSSSSTTTRIRSSSSSSSSSSGSSSSSNSSSDSENGTGNGDGAIYTRSSPSSSAPTSALSLLRPQSPSSAAAASAGTGTGTSPPSPPASGTADSVYQAFVRQWCFAQGGGPGSPNLGVVVR